MSANKMGKGVLNVNNVSSDNIDSNNDVCVVLDCDSCSDHTYGNSSSSSHTPMSDLNLGNLNLVQELYITNHKCRDSGVQGVGAIRSLKIKGSCYPRRKGATPSMGT
ncbi:hypothetical protein J6590_020948 [Homalodisca vitripennis]|nr:hypothetical protein J6590_020948 [Homalodisca vitripennis]